FDLLDLQHGDLFVLAASHPHVVELTCLEARKMTDQTSIGDPAENPRRVGEVLPVVPSVPLLAHQADPAKQCDRRGRSDTWIRRVTTGDAAGMADDRF